MYKREHVHTASEMCAPILVAHRIHRDNMRDRHRQWDWPLVRQPQARKRVMTSKPSPARAVGHIGWLSEMDRSVLVWLDHRYVSWYRLGEVRMLSIPANPETEVANHLDNRSNER
jgi:hypothetical protein